jgi:hypothetical protein
MIGKKINQLATELAPATTDLTIIGDPTTGVSKKITLSQIANLFATSGTVTSVAVTETGNALTITGSPITTAGTINIGFAGAATQYVRGDGQLSDFPTSTGGGSSVSYYLNSSVSQGTIGGVAYRQFNKTPIAGAGTDITVSTNGYIASYITDANDPALLEVPAGNFNCELYFSVNSNNHNPYIYAEVYKYDGTTFTLLGSSQSVPEYLTNGTTLSPYYFAVPVTATVLTTTDRIAIRIYANVDGRTVTLHTENSHLCQVVTTFSKGLTSLNNLTRQVQFLATGTSGTDFNIASSTATHTFNLPTASATNRGALSSADWTTFNNKQNALTNPITGTGASGQVAFFNGTTSLTGTNNFFWDTANNRLGIGTTTPQRSIEIYNTTADNHLRLSGNAPSVSMGEAVTGSIYQAKFGLVTTNGQFVSAGVAGDFVIISQTGATIIGTSSTEKMRVNTSGNVSINNTNNTYKLDVTGTGRYTGQLRLESTITDGTNTYTLPSATGTLALTSQLTGGTVTSVGLSSATSGVTIGSTPITTSGTITLAIATASGSQQGLLSSTDWTTFNNKQNALTNPVTGTGTTNYLPKFTGASTIGDSTIQTDGTGNLMVGSANAGNAGSVNISVGLAGTTSGGLQLWAATNQTHYIQFGDATSGAAPYTGYIGYAHNNDSLIFGTATSTKMTLNASGNLSIGNTNDTYKLDVTGSVRITGNIGINGVAPTYPLYVRVGTDQRFRVVDGGSGYTQLASLNDAEGSYTPIMLGNSWLSIASTGAATFTAATQDAIQTVVRMSGNNASGQLKTLDFKLTAGTPLWTISTAAVGTDAGINIMPNGSAGLSIAYAGAATFSSSVTANGLVVLGSNSSSTPYALGSSTPRFQLMNGGVYGLAGDVLTNGNTYLQSQRTDGNTTAYNLLLQPLGGNVGIGTSSPTARLDVKGASPFIRITDSSASAESGLVMDATGGFIRGGLTINYSTGEFKSFCGVSGNNYFQTFHTNGAERMRITSGGEVCINRTSSLLSSVLSIDQFGSGTSNIALNHFYTGNKYLDFGWYGTSIGSITNTNGTSVLYNTTSDYRLKQDLKQFNGLDLLNKIKTYDYEWKSDGSRMYGVIAHELQSVINYAVTGVKDGKEMQGVDYSKIVPVLIKAIQELNDKIK